jgi:hypothetical protein
MRTFIAFLNYVLLFLLEGTIIGLYQVALLIGPSLEDIAQVNAWILTDIFCETQFMRSFTLYVSGALVWSSLYRKNNRGIGCHVFKIGRFGQHSGGADRENRHTGDQRFSFPFFFEIGMWFAARFKIE